MPLDDLACHGGAFTPSCGSFDLGTRVKNGLNSYLYLRGNTWTGSGPLGLYDLDDGYGGEDLAEDVFDTIGLLDPLPGPADIIRATLGALVQDYSANLEWDVDWATDWSRPEDDHSRTDNSWVGIALGRGLHDAFDIGLPGTDATLNPLDLFAGASRGTTHGAGGKAAKRGGGSGRVHTGHTIHTAIGQRAHVNYSNALGHGYQFEFNVPGGRVDAIDIHNKIVRELKPDIPAKRVEGERQLLRYIKALARHPDAAVRGEYTGYVDTYKK